MKTMTENLHLVLERAHQMKAQEVLIHSQKEPQLRVGSELCQLQGLVVPQTIQKELEAIFDEKVKAQLLKTKHVEGVKVLEKIKFKFSLQMDMEGIGGALSWKPTPAINNTWWGFSNLMKESLLRSEGLILIYGGRRSGKTSALLSLMSGTLGKVPRSIALISDHDEWEGDFENLNGIYKFRSSDMIETMPLPAHIDAVFIDSNQYNFCEKALQWAERGHLVVLTQTYKNIQIGLQRFIDQVKGERASNWLRLSQTLNMAVGVCLMSGVETPLQGAFECLFPQGEIRHRLQQGQIQDLNALIAQTSDKDHGRTLNQSLFQLLVKRKIEFKTAFAISPEPQELDEALKKIGI